MDKYHFKKLLIFSLALTMLFSSVFSAPSDSLNSAGVALEEGDYVAFFGFSVDAFNAFVQGVQLVRILAVLLGLVVISLIVLRISRLLSKPVPDVKEIMKTREDDKFKKMFIDRQKILEDMKQKLSPENKIKK